MCFSKVVYFFERRIREDRTMEKKPEYWVKIVSDPDLKHEKSKNAVQPGHLYLRRGDRVRFTALHSDAVVFIPHSQVLFGRDDPIIRLDKKGVSNEELVVQAKVDRGRYPYAVFCKTGNDFAAGGSSPAMIVEV